MLFSIMVPVGVALRLVSREWDLGETALASFPDVVLMFSAHSSLEQ